MVAHPIADGKEMYVTCGTVSNITSLVPRSHEEADTRMFLHVADAVQKGIKRVVLRTVDADVVIPAVASFTNINPDELWMDLGTGYSFRYIPVHQLFSAMNPRQCDTLPTLLGRQKKLVLSDYSDPITLASTFNMYFIDKIANIRAEFPLLESSLPPYSFGSMDSIMPTCAILFDRFTMITSEELTKIVSVMNKTTCSSEAPNDTAYKRWSCHSGFKLLCKLCRTSPPPAMGARFTVFWACRPCGPAGWLALLLTKAGDVETNPGPTTLNKKVWICDICHRQIHVRKQISIRCNRIEHCVHLRCAGIRQAQYTDTWTCHLHRESRLTPHTDITPPHRSRPLSKPPTHSRPLSKPLPTPHLHHPHHRNQNTDTCPTLPLSPEDW